MTAAEWRQEQRWKRFVDGIKASGQETYTYYTAIDIGKSRDRTVLTALETATKDDGEQEHVVMLIDTLPGKMSYVEQAKAIAKWHDRDAFRLWGVKCLVDSSGVGEACCDQLDHLKFDFKRAIITGGESSSYTKGRYHIGRNKLIRNLITFLGRPNSYINSDCAGAQTFHEEFLAMGVEYSKHGGALYTSSMHDDCVMSLALAAFLLERSGKCRTGVRSLF